MPQMRLVIQLIGAVVEHQRLAQQDLRAGRTGGVRVVGSWAASAMSKVESEECEVRRSRLVRSGAVAVDSDGTGGSCCLGRLFSLRGGWL